MDEERLNYHDRDLMVALTDAEKIDRGRQMANAHRELADVQEQHKMVKQQQKAREAEIEARISGLATSVSIGQEQRKVRCYEIADVENGRVRVFRADTETLVDTRALKMEERQTSIPGALTGGGKEPDITGGPSNVFPIGGENIRAGCGHVTAFEGDPSPALCRACKAAVESPDDIPPKQLEVIDEAEPAEEGEVASTDEGGAEPAEQEAVGSEEPTEEQ